MVKSLHVTKLNKIKSNNACSITKWKCFHSSGQMLDLKMLAKKKLDACSIRWKIKITCMLKKMKDKKIYMHDQIIAVVKKNKLLQIIPCIVWDVEWTSRRYEIIPEVVSWKKLIKKKLAFIVKKKYAGKKRNWERIEKDLKKEICKKKETERE
jgi:hypothetical protein